jgi:hypothetical protein
MAVTAMAGVVSFGPQSAMGSVATSWYKHRVTQIDLAPNDDTRLGVPEVGGIPVPSFPYKAGILVSGGMTMQPRLENIFGWLLYGVMGKVTTTSSIADPGTYDHVFTFATDASSVPFMSFRKHIPRKGTDASSDLGEVFKDCKITSLALTFPNDAPVTARVDSLGREFSFDHDPTAWTYVNGSFEDYPSIPIGCQTDGYLKLPEFSVTELPVVAATVTFQNIPLDIRQERVFGSPYLEDITIIMRQLTFDVLVKWNDPDLYATVLTGSAVGTTWTPTPYTGSLEVMVNSPDIITGETTNYSLKIEAQDCMFAMTEGITLAGNQAVMTRFTGTALAPVSGEYCQFTLHNKQASYTWPVADVTPPTISTATIEDIADTIIRVNFSEPVQTTTSWMAGWTARVNTTNRVIVDAWRYDNDTVYFELASAVTAGQTVDISYDDAIGNVTDWNSVALADVTQQSVTNNVT